MTLQTSAQILDGEIRLFLPSFLDRLACVLWGERLKCGIRRLTWQMKLLHTVGVKVCCSQVNPERELKIRHLYCQSGCDKDCFLSTKSRLPRQLEREKERLAEIWDLLVSLFSFIPVARCQSSVVFRAEKVDDDNEQLFMTPAISYNEIHSTVETELRSLLAEKEQLQEQLQNIEQRLGVINQHEEKLRRVRDSLADLLSINPVADSTNGEAVLNTADAAEPSIAAEPVIAVQSEEIAAEAAASAVEAAGEPDSQELLLETGESTESANSSDESAHSSAPESDAGESAASRATLSVETPSPIASPNTLSVPQVADFNSKDFFERFPHISKTHPVHVLARKLLEYFGSGLRLSEIARLIEQLGYRHNSRNFTDSVHSALKNKRKATGEFRFNAQKSVWELSHWENSDVVVRRKEPEAEQAKETSSGNSENSQATVNVLTGQEERAVAKQLSKANTRNNQAPPKKNLKGGIKVYKAQK